MRHEKYLKFQFKKSIKTKHNVVTNKKGKQRHGWTWWESKKIAWRISRISARKRKRNNTLKFGTKLHKLTYLYWKRVNNVSLGPQRSCRDRGYPLYLRLYNNQLIKSSPVSVVENVERSIFIPSPDKISFYYQIPVHVCTNGLNSQIQNKAIK